MNRYNPQRGKKGTKCKCGHIKSDHRSRIYLCEWPKCFCPKFTLDEWDESEGIKDLQKTLKSTI